MPCMDSKTIKPSAMLSTCISKESSICERLARPILPAHGTKKTFNPMAVSCHLASMRVTRPRSSQLSLSSRSN
jgi:hypothetical protein